MASPQYVQGWHPQQVNTPPQYLGRKTLPIKRNDAEPLYREDLQYDLLYYIFANQTAAFTDSMAPGKPTVNFCDLYVNALFNSSKCSKVLKDKMVETPAFAIEFAKISLLTNVGRINTTMAFFHEMKTALRTYHPVPSLQKTGGNLQDAPRIKNCLKAALLNDEIKTPPPATPAEVLEKLRQGKTPPTSVVNLIFVLSNASNALPVAQAHFDPPIEFLDLFLPINLSSESRAKAFLFLMYYYLQGPDKPNPFADEYSREHPGKVPRMRNLSKDEMLQENVDPKGEIEWGSIMSRQRGVFLQSLVYEQEEEKRKRRNPTPPPLPSSSMPALANSFTAEELAAIRRPPAHRMATSTSEDSRASSNSQEYSSQPLPTILPTTPSYIPTSMPFPAQDETVLQDPGEERTMLQQAWHIANTVDPLADSDQEQDNNARFDLERRLRVLSRLRGKNVTPPPKPVPPIPGSTLPQPVMGWTEAQFPGMDTIVDIEGVSSKGRLQQVQSWR